MSVVFLHIVFHNIWILVLFAGKEQEPTFLLSLVKSCSAVIPSSIQTEQHSITTLGF